MPDWLITRAPLGAFGFHPSLLPSFKGRRAVENTIAEGVRMTGGTIYELSADIDGGHIVDQNYVQIIPYESASQLWRRVLAPLGVEMICALVNDRR